MTMEKNCLTLEEVRRALLDEEALSGLGSELLSLFERYVDLRLRSILYKPKEEKPGFEPGEKSEGKMVSKVLEEPDIDITKSKYYKPEWETLPATAGQIRTLKSIMRQRNIRLSKDPEEMTMAQASKWITALTEKKKR